jgi:hypothetical protein
MAFFCARRFLFRKMPRLRMDSGIREEGGGRHVAKRAPSGGLSVAGKSKLKEWRESVSEVSLVGDASWGSSALLVFGGVRGMRGTLLWSSMVIGFD